MINPQQFFDTLTQSGVGYYTGVPDSLLKAFCAYVTDNTEPNSHVIAANEGAAIGLAIGNYLATAQVPLVYMQNSGLGNTINPLTSLADPKVYGIPMLLLIGWRGEPGVKDEPQHIKQGEVTLDMLEAIGVAYDVIDQSEADITGVISRAVESAKQENRPRAIVVKKGTFSSYKLQSKSESEYFGWSREEAIKAIIDSLDTDDIVVSTTGMPSREVFEYREQLGHGHQRDFLTVGGMGHASQIAAGIAAQKPNRRVICIDGDGAALMHMGSLAITGKSGLTNFTHIILNNGAHDSVGGQPTVGFDIDFVAIARACGYAAADSCKNASEVMNAVKFILEHDGPSLLEICVDKGNRADLGRPTVSPSENRDVFSAFVKG